MIVHVYNPERIVNNGTMSKTNNSKVVVPPSPKLLRHSSFKGFQNRSGAAAAESPPCLLNKRLRDKEEATAMDSSSDGLWSNLPPTAASQPSQMACTCHCSSSSSQETSGHYFTPVSSFTMDDSKEPDSLEYKNERTSVRESPPMRKASLDRILSPQVQRRPVYFSSPHSSGAAPPSSSPGDKSLSPVAAAVPLSTSMSNASIHSNYSEDSLTATPAGQRWNKYGQWIADSGSCMEQRPPAVNSSSLDFSKDSLNTSSAVQEPEEEEEEDSESCSSSVKLEPLAFTIDFGDVTPVHKKKETPKRLAERLTSARHSSTTTKSTCEQQQQSTSESKNAKMLKSLSSRLGGGGHQLPLMESSVPHNSRRSATPNSKGESSSSSRNSSVNRASQNNNNNGSGVAQQQRKSSKVGLKQRTPSPTPPSSPVKSGRPPPPPPALGSSSRNRRKLQQQQSDPEGIEDEEEIVLVDNEIAVANDAAEEEELIHQQQQQAENNDDDTASETGTYTIGKDSPSPDEDQSRRDIDRVFGLVVSAASIPLDSSNSSGNHPQWVSDWAAQVVQQQEAAAMLPSGVSVKPPSHPQHRPPPPELPTTARPRRKLPSLPPVSTPRSRSSTRPSPAEMSDPSDSSLETESFLRDTESVVSAMQARMDGRSSTESDVETRSSSTSYRPTSAQLPGGDIENSIGRKLSAQLRAKIRSLDESYQQSTATTTNTPSGNVRKGSYVISSSTSGSTAVTQAGVNNVIHNELHGSGGEDAKSLHSDSSLSDITSGETSSRSRHHEDHKAAGQNAPTVRYNRALSLRRGRLGLDGDQTNVSNPSGGGGGSPSRGSSPQVPAPSARKLSSASGQSQASSRAGSTASASSFSRNDGGRFSLRVGSNKTSSSTTPTVKPKVCKNPIQQQQPVNLPPMGGPRKSRSNSTLSSKEAEFQNWKRRKNYDPMKAAAEGKKKEAARRSTTLTMSQSMIGPVTSSISPSSQSPSPPPRTIIRSASFTCVNSPKNRSGLERSSEIQQEMEMKYSNGNRRTSYRKPSSMFYSSEDETETMYNSSPSKKAISKTGSAASTRAHYLGLNLMPSSSSSSSTHLQYRHHNSSPPSLPADFSDLASITSNDIDLNSSPGSPRRKHYMEDGLLMRTSASNSSLRARTKLEALDNLVISTIHGLSSKIRGNAEGLLRKLRPQYLDDLERLGLIDDTLNRLADCVTESPIHAVTGGRSSSRELSGTLKVMKRVEQVFQALDQVLFEEVLEGGGEEGAILNDGGTTTEGEDWNGGYTSGDFY